MIDMLLVLLIFFMSVTTTDVMMRDDRIILPIAPNAKRADKRTDSGQTVVNIIWNKEARSGDILIDEQPVSAMALPPVLAARKASFLKLNPTSRFRVLVRADEHAHYRFIQEILRACSLAGISAVTFSVIQTPAATEE